MFSALVNDIENNALSAPFHTSIRRCFKIIHSLHFCLVDSLLNEALNLMVNWIEALAVRQPQIWCDE